MPNRFNPNRSSWRYIIVKLPTSKIMNSKREREKHQVTYKGILIRLQWIFQQKAYEPGEWNDIVKVLKEKKKNIIPRKTIPQK